MGVKVVFHDLEEVDLYGDIEVCLYNDGWLEFWDEKDCLLIASEGQVKFVVEEGQVDGS